MTPVRSAIRWRLAAALLAAPALAGASVAPVDGRVRLNSVGFTPGAVKAATVAASATRFRVVRVSDDGVAFEGSLSADVRTAPGDTDETVRIADFSALQTAGEYQLDVPGVGHSAPFRVASNVWNEPFQLVSRGLHLWRCGAEVSATWNGLTYHHDACHLTDGWLDFLGGGHVRRDGTQGWHDAGDYNKYVVNAGVTMGLLFKAWEHHRERIGAIGLDLPESGNGVPDLLNEMRWELDWLLKMQAADGRVYHKLSETRFDYWGIPKNDSTPRYFVPWGTTATADFTAVMAMAARHYAEFDSAYASRCLAAARAAWAVLAANPVYVPSNQTGFSTGAYEAGDGTHRLWAAAEMWAATGEPAYLQNFETAAAGVAFSSLGPTWSDVGDLGLATYLETNSPGRDPTLVQRLRSSLFARAAAAVQTVNAHAYGRGLGGATWFWGVNGSVAAQTFLLHLADRLGPDPAYRQAAEESVGYLFGRNFHNRSYVTGLGYEPPLHPHDRRGEPAWPGYLVGGGWPTGRSWQDVQADYTQNEIAINWNASLIYALAALVLPVTTPDAAASSEWAMFVAGQPGSYRPRIDGLSPTSFTASGLPHWAGFDAATGLISGTPADDPATPAPDARKIHAVTLREFQGATLVSTRQVNLMVATPGNDIRMVNLSARGQVGTGEDILIAGFVTSGTAPRTLLLRGIGPSLADFAVGGLLADPRLALFDRAGARQGNDNWHDVADADGVRAFSTAVGAFALADSSRDSAVVCSLPAGAYTSQVIGVGGATGIALAEIYDGPPSGHTGRLLNISARARIGGGDAVLIAGTVLDGGGSARILIRAVGPTLATQAVGDPLLDPVLKLCSGQTVLATNDDWGSSRPDEIAAAAAAAHAFPLPAGSRDAALIAPLVSGAFTVIVEGKSGASGVALVELYLLP